MLLVEQQRCITLNDTSAATNFVSCRYKELTFAAKCDTLVNGLVGYFEAVLYKDVLLSILPTTHSPGMISWFPIFFPLKVSQFRMLMYTPLRENDCPSISDLQTPQTLTAGESITVAMWRCTSEAKVWYEWATLGLKSTTIHNPTGRSYWIGI
jgi:protein arginine N-methyltransferase 5